MTLLGRFLGLLNFKLDVGGLKTRVVLALGDVIVPRRRRHNFYHHDIPVTVPKGNLLRLWNYAPYNIQRTYHESALWGYVKDHVRDRGRFIDIGANIGGYLYEAMMLNLDVIGFEPHPELGPVLASNPEMFGQVHPVALADAEGVLPFHLSDANPGGSSLVDSDAGWEASGYTRTVQVHVTTFDHFLADRMREWDQVDMVKIDVEGAEEAVIRGMEKSLQSGKIQAVWCEVRGPESDRNPGSAERVTQLMEGHGYHAYLYDRMAEEPFVPFTSHSPQPQYFDVLYVRNQP